jgi:oligosaccharide translocation protein RFT1
MADGKHSEAASARAAARGTMWTVSLKILSFAATQWTLRTLDPVALGKASIQLELMLSTTLFVAREGFRLALTKPDTDFNVAWISPQVGTLASVLALSVHWVYADQNDSDYRLAGFLYCLASWIEAWAEPWALWSLRNMDIATKAKAEGVATMVKTLSLVLLLPVLPQWPTSAFGVSQLLYAVTYSLSLYRSTSPPPRRKSHYYFSFDSSSSTLYLVGLFTVQGIFKHVLTEGDRIVLTSLADHYHQGVYAMGSAYGGMVARLLLQPLEENGRLLWSRHPTNSQSYTSLIHLVLHVGLLFSTVAVHYTSVLLRVFLAGRTTHWGDSSEAATVLSAFCVYTAFMAWNGMTEAFVYAVASSGSQVTGLGVAHMIVGGTYMAVAPFLVSRHGTVGLVVANCVAMCARACYAVHFATVHFSTTTTTNNNNTWVMGRKLVRGMFPTAPVLLAYGVAFVATRVSLHRLQDYEQQQQVQSQQGGGLSMEWLAHAGQHVTVGVLSVLFVATVSIPFERDFRQSLRSMFREKLE